MIFEVIATLAGGLTTNLAKDALDRALVAYKTRHRSTASEFHTDELNVPDLIIVGGGILGDDNFIDRAGETPIQASRSTQEVIQFQLTILEVERNRLIPVATREHWVALVFAVIAGLVFFTSVVLVIFGTLTQAMAVFVASSVPGFLSKVFFSREANMERRLKEITSDLRESEKVKERLGILEEALKVIPEQYQARVLEDFTKKTMKPVQMKASS